MKNKQCPALDDSVELVQDQLEGGLRAGAMGVVCSIWFEPNSMYEVEFQPADEETRIRALLSSEYLRIIGAAARQ